MKILWCFLALLTICSAVKRCTMPEDRENGSFSLSKRENKVGGLATFTCNEGYDLVGQAQIKCLKSTKDWAAPFPTCELGVRCPTINTTIENGVVKIDEGEMVIGKVVKFECLRGFYIPDASQRSITCQEDGTWNNEIPECIRSLCELPDVEIENGFIIDAKNGTYHSNDPVYYGCNPGYKIRGSWQVCKPSKGETGGWDGDVPTCVFVKCSALPELENGRKSVNKVDVGTVVSFYCSSGYALDGPPKRECLENGRWSKGDPVCIRPGSPTDCKPLPIPINGAKSGTRYNLNNFVTFTCNPGYTRIGESTRQCLETGWTGTKVTCEAPDEYSDLEEVKAKFIQNFDSLRTVTERNEIVEEENERELLEACNGTTDGCQAGRLIDLNYNGRLEVYFVFDGSQSVGQENFDTAKRFAKAVINKLGVGSEETGPLYGIVSYSNEAKVELYLEGQELSDVLKDLEKMQYTGKGTNTRAGLEELLKNVIPLAKARLPETDITPQRAVFLVTDGESNTGGKPYDVADDLRKMHDAKIHCIGISQSVNKDELRDVASTPTTEYYFHLADFKDLDELAYALVSEEYDYSSCGIGGSNIKQFGRIFGGNDANPEAYPWQVAFYEQFGHNNQDLFCGGTLISDEWVLTAAHCFDQRIHTNGKKGVLFNTAKAFMGLTHLNRDIGSSQGSFLDEVIIHKKYDPEQSPFFDYDIALAKLSTPPKLNPRVRTACLPNVTGDNLETVYSLQSGDVTVTGWGASEEGAITSALQELVIKAQAFETCEADNENSLRMFCAGGEAGKDACQGDSGGPVVRGFDFDGEVRYEVVGIVSWGRDCGLPDKYGYYTHVPKLVDWIRSQTGLA